jgi:hypothetical protein
MDLRLHENQEEIEESQRAMWAVKRGEKEQRTVTVF